MTDSSFHSSFIRLLFFFLLHFYFLFKLTEIITQLIGNFRQKSNKFFFLFSLFQFLNYLSQFFLLFLNYIKQIMNKPNEIIFVQTSIVISWYKNVFTILATLQFTCDFLNFYKLHTCMCHQKNFRSFIYIILANIINWFDKILHGKFIFDYNITVVILLLTDLIKILWEICISFVIASVVLFRLTNNFQYYFTNRSKVCMSEKLFYFRELDEQYYYFYYIWIILLIYCMSNTDFDYFFSILKVF